MRTILQINQQDVNELLLQTIRQLMLQNSEILIQPLVKLEEYDTTQNVTEVMQALSDENYHVDFLKDIEKGLKSSSIYVKNED